MSQSQPAEAVGETRTSLDALNEQLSGTSQFLEHRLERLTDELEEARHERLLELAEKERIADRLQSLLRALPAAVVVLDGQGRVQEQNAAAEQLLGGALQDRLWRDLVDQLFIPQTVVSDDLLLRNGRYVTLSTCPLGHEPGQILMLHDVTEKRQLQQRLEHSRRLADMGRMAASLAHQIRTPLSSALLYVSQLCQMKSADAMQQRFSAKALESLKGLEKLIADMLLFANSGSGERETIEVQTLFHGAATPLLQRMREQSIELEENLSQQNPIVEVNTTMVTSALQNLINNAMQSMPEGGVITLSTGIFDGQVELGVRDSGPGVAPALQSRLFEPFVTTREGGTGLGLAVVQAVAQSMGGDVTCESVKGEGSYFAIRLPLVKSACTGQSA